VADLPAGALRETAADRAAPWDAVDELSGA
jgi:hypothetical protein